MAVATIEKPHTATTCSQAGLPIRDTLDIINGKWKMPIIGSLIQGKKRFKEMEREITGITARMLSKELKDLETNDLVRRTVYNTMPVTVEYELTEYGRTLKKVFTVMSEWGTQHRERIMSKKR